MGIHDRDYMKQAPRARRGLSLGTGRSVMFTMTTWLILINVAVFAVDRVITGSGTGVRTVLGMELDPAFHDQHDRIAVMPNNGGERPSPNYPGYVEQPLFDSQTGDVIGRNIVAYKGFFDSLGYFSTVRIAELQVWRFVTFQFLHFDVSHLFLNMMGLFFFGPIAERYLSSRRLFLAFYLLCGMAGAGLYLLLNLAGWLLPMQLPVVLANQPWVPLVGASAGVFGVLWAAAFLRARDIMLLFGIIPMRIKTGVYLFTGIAFFNLLTGGNNAGGDAAHIGGAIAGAFFIRRPHLLLNFFDDFLRTSDRHPAFTRGGKNAPRKKGGSRNERRLNRILDKVKKRGMGSLNEEESRFLDRETNRRRGRG